MLKRQDDEDDDEVEIEHTNFENNSSFRPISNPLKKGIKKEEKFRNQWKQEEDEDKDSDEEREEYHFNSDSDDDEENKRSHPQKDRLLNQYI